MGDIIDIPLYFDHINKNDNINMPMDITIHLLSLYNNFKKSGIILKKCDEKYLGRTEGQTDSGKTVYPPPPSGSEGIKISLKKYAENR